MAKNRMLGLFGLVGAAFIGGAFLPALIRFSTTLLHPFLVNWLRIALGLPLLLLILRGKQKPSFTNNKKHLLTALILGAGISLNMTMFAFGVTRTTLIASQLIYVLAPIAASILAYFLLKEQVNRRKIIGMVIAFLGVLSLLLFSRNPDETLALGTFTGNSIIFVGMLGYAVYMVFSKKLSAFYSIFEMILITNTSASVILLPFALYGLSITDLGQLQWQALGAILLLALGALIFTACSQLSIKHLSTHTASLGSLLSPEFAALAGIVFYGEQLSVTLLISMALSIGGIYLSVSAEKSSFLGRIKTAFRQLHLRTKG